ncbi:hypothetical protein KA005_53990, partial [bacterium]|nr:hypothetical protein [bacterium]
WPKDEKEPNLNPKYMSTKDNLIGIWGDGLVREYIPERNMKHWLVKPRHKSWNKEHACENFRDLAEEAGRVLTEKGFLSRLKLPESILKLSEYKLTNSQKTQLWVLVVHELGNTKRFVSKPSDIKASILHDIIPDKFEEKPPSAYYEVQKDFFYESSLVISRLLEIEDLNKQGLSQTRHSPDFRSVNWFGTVHYFTATQAAIVKLLWDARKNQTPDIGQQTLLVTVESDSNRLVDVFKGHKTYKKLIGNGETKGSYRLTEPNK